jgi:CRP-like cAMP-binding protein
LFQILYSAGAPIEDLYFVEQGVVSLLTMMADGASIEAGMIGMEGLVGLPALFGDERLGQRAIVQAPGCALGMTAAEFGLAFDESADVRTVMLGYMGRLFTTAAQTAACNRLHSLKQRCARWLLMMYDRLQSDEMPLTHDFLSSMLGVRRTRVTEAAGELQRSGLIRYGRGLVTILDHQGLAAMACECYRNHDRFWDSTASGPVFSRRH